MHRNRLGFTLIELLVVIAIIAILAAILFPIFTRAKKRAQEAACLANLKQIGSAMSLYLQDSNDKYPTAFAYKGIDSAGNPPGLDAEIPSAIGLLKILLPYSKTAEIWTCPTGARRAYGAATCTYPAKGSHGMVGWILLDNGTYACTNYVSYPLNTFAYADGTFQEEFCRGWSPLRAMQTWGKTFTYGPMSKKYPNPLWNNRLIQDGYAVANMWRPHGNGTNILYHDGHVYRARDFRDPNNPADG